MVNCKQKEMKKLDWISVKTKLPKLDERVLCCNFYDDWIDAASFQWWSDDGTLIQNGWMSEGRQIFPTHWKKLPKLN